MVNLREVQISQGALYNIVMSVLDTFPREEAGSVYGFCEGKKSIITASCPMVTAKRGRRAFDQGKRTGLRLNGVERAISMNGEHHSSKIGGFHSHTIRGTHDYQDEYHEDPNKLSTMDLKDAEARLRSRNFEPEDWIEILVKVRKRDLSRKQPIGESATNYQHKLRLVYRVPQREGEEFASASYDLLLIGYQVSLRSKHGRLRVEYPGREKVKKRVSHRELRIRRRKAKVVSVKSS